MKENWTYKKLTDVCDIQYGYPFDSANFSTLSNDGMPLIRIRDVKDGYSNTYYKGDYPKEYIIHKGDYLVGMDGEFNIAPWKSGDALLNQRVCKVSSKSNEVSIGYLYRFLTKELKKIEDETPFVTVKHLSAKRLNQVLLPVPPIETQSRIVSELDLLQSIIDKQKAQLKELDNLAQAVFYDMFGDPVENDKGWETIYLKKEIKIISGFAFRSDKFSDDGIPLLRIGNINTGKLKTEQIVFYPEDKKLDRYKVYPNDLVISLTGTAGKDDYGNVCVLDNTYPEYYLNQRNAKLEPSSSLNTIFLQFIFKDVSIKKKLTGINRGIRQGNISNKDIENLLVPVPPLSLQQSFAAKIESIEKQKAAINQSIAETQRLFDYTMDKYFG